MELALISALMGPSSLQIIGDFEEQMDLVVDKSIKYILY